MVSEDIGHILENWEFDPDELNVRKIEGLDGTEKIQLRLDLGVLQMEQDGRPDGKRPHEMENLLQFYRSEYEQAREDGEDFVLSSEELRILQQESIQYYHRYLCFAELGDHDKVVRDTAHNLEVLEFVEEFAEDAESAWAFLQYFPYIQMMHTQAKVQLALEEERYSEGMEMIDDSIETIRAFNEKWGMKESDESSREIRILKEWRETVEEKKPLSKLEKLESELEEAVRLERYEEAAEIRDKLNELQESQEPS